MGTSDVITDLLLIVFPIPIVLKSAMAFRRKFSLVLLFGLSFILVGITLYRVVGVIDRHSDQQFRSLLASLEILAAAAVSNAVVLGSFIRDRGEKKKRFRFGSTGGSSSLDTASQQRTRTITQRHWGSDADLVGDLGMRLRPDLEERRDTVARPAPIALPLASQAHVTPKLTLNSNWGFPSRPSADTDETDLKAAGPDLEKPPSPTEIVSYPFTAFLPHWLHFTTCLDSICSKDILLTSSLGPHEEMLNPISYSLCLHHAECHFLT